LVASFAIIHRPSYYTAGASGYYQADAEAQGVWLRGNEKLGVVQGSAVSALDFDLLCNGCDTSGRKLVKTPKFKRRALGVDITLSSPKAVSVLYAVGDEAQRQAIAEAEDAAVEATIRLIETEIPLARRGKDGVRREFADFVLAKWTHSEARPEVHSDGSVLASVQRHHHLCVPSICVRSSDGTFGAIDTAGGLRSWKKSLGAAFRLQLSVELERRGFAIERVEGDWRWTVAGVPTAVCKFFSARRTAIETELAKAGLTSMAAPAAAAAITRRTRRAKETNEDINRFARWRAAVVNLGFSPEGIIEAALAAGRAATAVRSEASGARIQQEIRNLPATLTEFESTFQRRHLIEAACNGLVCTGTSVIGAIEAADDLIKSRAIVELGQTRDGPILSTPQMVKIERRLVETAVDLARERIPAPDPIDVRRVCRENRLSEEQTVAAIAVTSGARIVSILAPAGSGKSTALFSVARCFQSMNHPGHRAVHSKNRVDVGYDVFCASLSWRASLDLGRSIAAPAMAIDALIARIDRRVVEGLPAFDRKTILFVDESSLQSSIQLDRLLSLVDRDSRPNKSNTKKRATNLCALVMVGDLKQQVAIGPGNAIRLVKDAIGAVELHQIHRQREIWARDAGQAFARGDAKSALGAFHDHGLIAFHDQLKPAIEALVEDWSATRRENPDLRLAILAKTNAEARAMATLLREKLKGEGAIKRREISLPAVDPSGNSHSLSVAVGDHLIALRRIDHLGVVNGTSLHVEGIRVSRLTKVVTITARCGDHLIKFTPADFADGKDRVLLANGLVSTIFRAQGLTVDRAFVLLTDRLDRRDAYVLATRSRGDTKWYGARNSIDGAIRSDSDDAATPIDDARRLQYLAQRLSRDRIKTTTLDLIDIAEMTRRHADRDRSRDRELGHEL
jgi:conjugative relaxase-like TrwC/TraI family protein